MWNPLHEAMEKYIAESRIRVTKNVGDSRVIDWNRNHCRGNKRFYAERPYLGVAGLYEHRERYDCSYFGNFDVGRYGFDRDWWTWRILCGRLVRLGALEYEQAEYQGPAFAGMVPGQPCLHLHIPSDADLSDQARRQSYARAWARWELPIVCESWLLAPALDKLLPADSRLRRFRAEFVPGPAEEDAEDVYQWLFQGEKRLDRLPQTTSLQRAAKAWLEEGKKIGIGWGRLRWPE